MTLGNDRTANPSPLESSPAALYIRHHCIYHSVVTAFESVCLSHCSPTSSGAENISVFISALLLPLAHYQPCWLVLSKLCSISWRWLQIREKTGLLKVGALKERCFERKYLGPWEGPSHEGKHVMHSINHETWAWSL